MDKVNLSRHEIISLITKVYLSKFEVDKASVGPNLFLKALFKLIKSEGWQVTANHILIECLEQYLKIYPEIVFNDPKSRHAIFELANAPFYKTPEWHGKKRIEYSLFKKIINHTSDPNLYYQYSKENIQ